MRKRNFPYTNWKIRTQCCIKLYVTQKILEYIRLYAVRSIHWRRMTVCGRCATFFYKLLHCNLSYSLIAIAECLLIERDRRCSAFDQKKKYLEHQFHWHPVLITGSWAEWKSSKIFSCSCYERALSLRSHSHIWTFIKIYKSATSEKN